MISVNTSVNLRPSFAKVIACCVALVLVWTGLAIWQFMHRQSWFPYACMSGFWLGLSLYLPYLVWFHKRMKIDSPPNFGQKLVRGALGAGMVMSSTLFPGVLMMMAAPVSVVNAVIGMVAIIVLGQVAVTYFLETAKADIRQNGGQA